MSGLKWLALFVFILANLVIAVSGAVMGSLILPRLRHKLNVTLTAGIAFHLFVGLEALNSTLTLLFGDASRVGTTWSAFGLRIAIAVSLTTFVIGILIDVNRWRKLDDDMADKGKFHDGR